MAHSFADPDHLPNRRGERGPADPQGLPRQRQGTTPQGHGRYPDYDVMANAAHWDEVTARVIRRRVEHPPPVRFFTPDEAGCLGAFLDVLLAQDAEPRIPVLEMVDDKLFAGRLDGFRHADLPEDPQTWRLVAGGLDEEARSRGAERFSSASADVREAIVGAFSQGQLSGGVWEGLDVSNAWSVVTRGALSEFYSHPWAWNEIGFGGPAYPRGYMRLRAGPDGADPHEKPEAFGIDPVTDVRGRR